MQAEWARDEQTGAATSSLARRKNRKRHRKQRKPQRPNSNGLLKTKESGRNSCEGGKKRRSEKSVRARPLVLAGWVQSLGCQRSRKFPGVELGRTLAQEGAPGSSVCSLLDMSVSCADSFQKAVGSL